MKSHFCHFNFLKVFYIHLDFFFCHFKIFKFFRILNLVQINNLFVILIFFKFFRYPVWFSDEQKLLPFWVVWRLWKCRNDLLFNKIKCTADEVISKAQVDLKKWLDSTVSSQIINSTERTRSENIRSHWSPHPSGWVKCNYDAAHREGSQDSGMG